MLSEFSLSFQLFYAGAGPFLYHHSFIGYGMLACFAEVNSIFLHGRMLLLMYGVPKASLIYRINNTFNLCTFVVLRLCNLLRLIPLVPEDCDFNSHFSCYLIMLTVLTILGINVKLFYRLIRSDLIYSHLNQPESGDDIMFESSKNNNLKSLNE